MYWPKAVVGLDNGGRRGGMNGIRYRVLAEGGLKFSNPGISLRQNVTRLATVGRLGLGKPRLSIRVMLAALRSRCSASISGVRPKLSLLPTMWTVTNCHVAHAPAQILAEFCGLRIGRLVIHRDRLLPQAASPPVPLSRRTLAK